GPKDAPFAGVIAPLLRPVELSFHRVHGNADAPLSGIRSGTRIAATRVNQGLNIGTVQVRAHDPHALTVRPIKLAVRFIDLQLLRGERATRGNDGDQVAPIKIGAQDGTVIGFEITHVGPIQMTGSRIYGESVGQFSALLDQDLRFRTAIGIQGYDSSGGKVKKE